MERIPGIGIFETWSPEETQLRKLQNQIDEIMLGKAQIDYEKLLMQLDSTTGAYEDAGPQSLGFKGHEERPMAEVVA